MCNDSVKYDDEFYYMNLLFLHYICPEFWNETPTMMLVFQKKKN